MRKAIFIVALVLLAVVGVAVGQRRVFTSAPKGHAMSVAVDSVMSRSDVTRVYCRLVGTPHTSSRVDAVNLTAGALTLEATDIDPIYFERAFQWEDEPDMAVEIDFPALSPAPKAFTLTVKTPYGDVTAKYPRVK